MGLWDKEVANPLDSLFDMNKDDILDPAEQALQFEYLTEQLKAQMPSYSDEDEEFDIDELELMDEHDRREALEAAGYSADDFGENSDDFDEGYFSDFFDRHVRHNICPEVWKA